MACQKYGHEQAMNKTIHTCVCVFCKVQINGDLVFGMYGGEDRELIFCILALLDFKVI